MPKTAGQGEEDYNEEGEDMDTDEENKGVDVETREEPIGNPKKKQRRNKEDTPLEGKNDMGLEICVLPSIPFPPQEKVKENLEEGSGEVVIKDRCLAWKNFNTKTSKMGIVREVKNLQILEEKEGKIHLEDLIEPALVAIIDNAREVGMNLLNNAKNNMIDNFRSIKWLFHELEEVKDRMGQLDSQGKKIEQRNPTDQGDRIRMVEKRMHNLETINHTMANQMLTIMKSLSENIVSLGGKMKARGLVVEKDGKDNEEDRMDEDTITDITQSHLDQSCEKT